MNYDQLVVSIAKLKAAEKITKQVMSELSRDILAYVMEERDVRPVNLLLSKADGQWALSPVNWRFACKYFHHFLPFTSNYDEVKDCINNGGERTALFFKKLSPKKLVGKAEEIAIWLADENNDIWKWSNSVAIDPPATNWLNRITDTVTKASDKGGLSAIDIMAAVMAAGIDADVLIKAISEAMLDEEEEAAA